MLVRYDYCEPWKGTHQCNCKCDGLKTILKSLNVDSANGIFIPLNQRKSLKNKKNYRTEFDKTKWSLSGDIIPNICSYHSILFSDDWIKIKHSYKQIRLCLIVSCREKQLEENWHLRMFVIWSKYTEVLAY